MDTELTPNQDRAWMELALAEARKSAPEDGRTHPKVGAVAVRDAQHLASAHRGQLHPGEHAEFTLLEGLLRDETLTGTTIFTTLEPCTRRGHPKVPCADRLLERGTTRVVIGMLDPNPEIRGSGVLRLREGRIAVEFFPQDLMLQIEELNRDFTRAQRSSVIGVDPLTPRTVRADQGLNDWYVLVNSVYWNRNFHLRSSELLAHLVEVIGGLSCVATRKKKPGVDGDVYVAKAIAWWLALCGKVGLKSVEAMLWDKFPGVCAYCHQAKCLGADCAEMKAQQPGPRWETLAEIGRHSQPPKRLAEWQRMFGTIYPVQQVGSLGAIFGRLAEELGELAEAVRVFPAEPGYFLSEAADVFAWLMQVENTLDQEVPRADRGRRIEASLARSYPDACADCGGRICSCPPILASTIGRIAHEVPTDRGTFDQAGRFSTPDKTRRLFLRDEISVSEA